MSNKCCYRLLRRVGVDRGSRAWEEDFCYNDLESIKHHYLQYVKMYGSFNVMLVREVGTILEVTYFEGEL